MTKEEFEKFVEEFFKWTASHDRSKAMWLLSLESWSQGKYLEAIREE